MVTLLGMQKRKFCGNYYVFGLVSDGMLNERVCCVMKTFIFRFGKLFGDQ